MGMEDRWTELKRFIDLPTAQLVAARLESEGIETQIPDQNVQSTLSHLGPALGGVRLLVRESQKNKSKAILYSIEGMSNGHDRSGSMKEWGPENYLNWFLRISVFSCILLPVLGTFLGGYYLLRFAQLRPDMKKPYKMKLGIGVFFYSIGAFFSYYVLLSILSLPGPPDSFLDLIEQVLPFVSK